MTRDLKRVSKDVLRWIAAWLCTLIAAPVIFTIAIAIVGYGDQPRDAWSAAARLAIIAPDFVMLLAGALSAIPALVIGIPAAIALERRAAGYVVYALAGGVLGFAGCYAMSLTEGRPSVDLAWVASLYGTIAATVFRAALHNLPRWR